MPSSTARRERLVSPLNLAVMVGVFALAFYLLKPDGIPGAKPGDRLSGDSASIADVPVDQLELAYLKARKSSGKIDDVDVAKVVEGLLNSGRIEDANSLLASYPDLELPEPLRFKLDMQLSAAQSDSALVTAIEHLLSTNRLHQEALIQQALRLSKTLPQPALTMEVYHLAALHPTDKAIATYRECGDYFDSRLERRLAASCYQQALRKLRAPANGIEGDDAKRTANAFAIGFDVQVALLPQLELNSADQQALVAELVDNTDANNQQLEALAPALLSVERPEAAYRVYARLALNDPEHKEQWLPLAAKWAQASGKLSEAAIFLEALAPLKSGIELDALKNEVQSLLIAGGRNRELFGRLSTRIADDPDDTRMLGDGIKLAMQLRETEQALQWNARWLKKFPLDLAAMELQSDLALASMDLPEALRWAERRVELEPENISSRVRLAQVSEWSASPRAALTHWQWLAKARHQPSLTSRKHALREVVRLGSLVLEPGIAVKALRELSLYDTPSHDDVAQMINLYELDGRAVDAVTAVQDIIVLHGVDGFYLRSLAALEYRHKRFAQSLSVWEQYVTNLGSDSVSTLARMELLWRMDKPDDAAQVAQLLNGNSVLSLATDYQLRLMAEISWRYRLPWLALLVQPQLDSIDVKNLQDLYARRTLDTLSESGDYDVALKEAVKLWASTGQSNFAIQAMQLAVKTNNIPVLHQFSAQQRDTQKLHSSPEYWTELAAMHLREGDNDSAHKAYQRVLKLDSNNVGAIAGLLWMSIAEGNESVLQSTLYDYKELAVDTPALWQGMAVGYLQLGAASTSLIWFDKLLDQIKTDYGMLLTYADALEYAGRAGQARKVRQYTLQRLRPLLVSGSQSEQSLLLRQYGRLSNRYGDIESNEELVSYLLKDTPSDEIGQGNEQLWRQDMAISWLMATQQHEHARLIMAQLHSKRLQAPAWQQLAVALKDENNKALEALVQANGPLSVGNHILALRQLGNDRQAYTMALKAMRPDNYIVGGTIGDRRIAQEQYTYLRNSRPSYLSGSVRTRSINGLGISEAGLSLRHTLAGQDLGMGLQVTQSRYDSDRYNLAGSEELSDIALSLYSGNSIRGARITTGLRSTEDDDQSYASARIFHLNRRARRELTAEMAYNEAASNSAELLIAGQQNRASLTIDQSFGKREFVRLNADTTQIQTRVDQENVARGLGGSAEVGMRGAFGSNAWSASVRAGQITYDREDVLPDELRLSDQSRFNNVLAEDVRSLSLGASLSRGGINGDFPQVSSPRYYLNASLGQAWPQKALGFQFDAGAGIRVLGGDELSFSLAHDTLGNAGKSDDSTSVGVNYRYHF